MLSEIPSRLRVTHGLENRHRSSFIARMDLLSSEIENATHQLESGTHMPSDYTASQQHNVNVTENSEKAKNWAMLGVLPIVAFVAAGNILVILAVKLDHKLRSSTNYFLTSLAVADLLVAITVMPPSLVMIINNYVWPFHDNLCGIWVMLDVCFSTASILHLCMISLDRYWALAQPFRHRKSVWTWKGSSSSGGWATDKRGKSKWRGSGLVNSGKLTKRVAKRILLVWGISLGIALPLPIMGHQDRNNIFVDLPGGGSMCVINIPEFTIYASMVAFFLPLVVMFVTYSLTIRTLQKQSKLVKIIMGKEGSISNWTRSSRSPSLTSGQSTKITRGSVTSDRDGYNKPITSTNEAIPSLPDIVCTSTESRLNTNKKDCNANTSEPKLVAPAENMADCTFHRSISEITTEKYDDDEDKGIIIVQCDNTSKGGTLQKSGSDASDTSSVSNQHSAFRRSPMLARANMKLSKVVSKFPLNRASTRRISASARSRVIATEQRASKVLGMIFTLFCLFWCPFFITNASSGMCICYGLQCNLDLMYNLMNWFVWVGYVSSGVNPCVYTLFSRQFRETFKKLICFRCSEVSYNHGFRARGFDVAGGSSTSSFHRDYSYKKYDRTRKISTLEDENQYNTLRSTRENFTTSQFKPNKFTKSDEDAWTASKTSEASEQTVENFSKFSRQIQWRSTWHSTARDEDIKTAISGSIPRRSSSKVTFRDTLLETRRKRQRQHQDTDYSSHEMLVSEYSEPGDLAEEESDTL